MHSQCGKRPIFVRLNSRRTKMATSIRHKGIIDTVRSDAVVVRILQSSACSGCQVKNICHAADSKEKLVEVSGCNTSDFRVGQSVEVAGTESQGWRAVLFAFGIPLVLLFIALVLTLAVTGNEKLAALAAIAVLVPYYVILFLCRNRMKKDFKFEIIDF